MSIDLTNTRGLAPSLCINMFHRVVSGVSHASIGAAWGRTAALNVIAPRLRITPASGTSDATLPVLSCPVCLSRLLSGLRNVSNHPLCIARAAPPNGNVWGLTKEKCTAAQLTRDTPRHAASRPCHVTSRHTASGHPTPCHTIPTMLPQVATQCVTVYRATRALPEPSRMTTELRKRKRAGGSSSRPTCQERQPLIRA
jgi:hypothetical protein